MCIHWNSLSIQLSRRRKSNDPVSQPDCQLRMALIEFKIRCHDAFTKMSVMSHSLDFMISYSPMHIYTHPHSSYTLLHALVYIIDIYLCITCIHILYTYLQMVA